MKLAVALSLITAASASVVNLTPDNYDELTAGKTVFIKYYAPWCGHCQAMAADWEKLAGDWESHEIGLIGEVDCDDQSNDSLCQAAGVQGFPTIKWGEPSELQDYQGGRDYGTLSAFAQENLKPLCSLKNLDLCDDEKKATINELQNKSLEELEEIIDGVESKVQDEEQNFEAEVEKLQEMYEKLQGNMDAKVRAIKEEANFNLVKSIFRSMGGVMPDPLADMDMDMGDFDEDDGAYGDEHDEF